MIKRILSLLAALLLTCSFACAEGFVAPAELSEDESNLLSLVGLDFGVNIYDFEAPEGTKAVLLTLWELQNGGWEVMNEFSIALEEDCTAGRFALISEECLGADLFASIWTEISAGSGTAGDASSLDLWSMSISTDSLYEKTSAVLDTKVPLMIQFLCEHEEMTYAELPLYHTPEAIEHTDHAYAVTAAFLSQTEAEYYGWEADDWSSWDEDWADEDWADEDWADWDEDWADDDWADWDEDDGWYEDESPEPESWLEKLLNSGF